MTDGPVALKKRKWKM